MPLPPPPISQRGKGHVRWSLIIVLLTIAAILGVGPAFYWEENLRGQAAWRAYEREALARGVKLKLTDYIPPEVPASENFASIPIMDAAFRASKAGQPPPDPFKLTEPKSGQLVQNILMRQELIDLSRWQSYFVEAGLLPSSGVDPARDILTALEIFAVPLAELREAGSRPSCRFPVDYEKAVWADQSHYGMLQSAAKLYTLRLSAHLALGDSGAAYEDFQEGLRLVTATKEEPFLIVGLVRMSIASLLQNAVWGGLARHQWRDAELRLLKRDLAGLDWLQDYVFAMNSERAGSNQTIDVIVANPHLFTELFSKEDSNIRKVLGAYPTGWFYQNKVRLNQFVDEMLMRIDPGQRRMFGERAVPSSPQNIQALPKKVCFSYFVISASVFEAVEKRCAQVATLTDQTFLACVLERFRLARGIYPERLAELTPAFVDRVPADVLSGEPYRYRRTDDGLFLLYSVGMDLHDDGGVIDPKVSTSRQKDWVWRYPAVRPATP